jgi:hypothetical protein
MSLRSSILAGAGALALSIVVSGAAHAQQITGEVVSVGENSITVKQADGSVITYHVPTGVTVHTPSQPVGVRELRSGQQVIIVQGQGEESRREAKEIRVNVDDDDEKDQDREAEMKEKVKIEKEIERESESDEEEDD